MKNPVSDGFVGVRVGRGCIREYRPVTVSASRFSFDRCRDQLRSPQQTQDQIKVADVVPHRRSRQDKDTARLAERIDGGRHSGCGVLIMVRLIQRHHAIAEQVWMCVDLAFKLLIAQQYILRFRRRRWKWCVVPDGLLPLPEQRDRSHNRDVRLETLIKQMQRAMGLPRAERKSQQNTGGKCATLRERKLLGELLLVL